MKPFARSLLSVSLLALAACSTVTALGPTVVEVVETRLVDRYLDEHPGKEATLEAVAVSLETISADATGTEITAAAIHLFVTKRADQWGMTVPEQRLIEEGLLAARDAALKGIGGGVSLHLGDDRVQPWIVAVQRGIREGITQHHQPAK